MSSFTVFPESPGMVREPRGNMPELVACPSCGCKVQVVEAALGRRIRCMACERWFLADADPGPTPEVPARPKAAGSLPPPRPPLCPRCHRSVTWEVPACPHCGHLFDPLDHPGRIDHHTRRDCIPHRGMLLDVLGNFSLIAGALGLCTGGLGSVIGLILGIPVVLMARLDLIRMASGVVDSAGRDETAFARNKAVVGIVLSLLSGLFYVLVFMEKSP